MVRSRRLDQEEPFAGDDLIASARSRAFPLRSPHDLDPLVQHIGRARFVLLGEASHGTHEYYAWRAALSRRLIEEKDFTCIAVEGDWPDCYRINRFVRGFPEAGESAREVLQGFRRWPTWMWANEEVADFVDWLRRHNGPLPAERQCGFYGLDVYGLWDSMYEVMRYLRRKAPSLPGPDSGAQEAARRAFRCFEPYGEDEQAYAHSTRWVPEGCEEEAVALLREMLARAPRFEHDDREAYFAAEQNARVVMNAEAYYRAMVRGGPESWNVRDRHMVETLDRLMAHLGPKAKAIVWEHNTHVGDARFTDMVGEGMVNVGQLVREARAAEGVVVAGFGSHRGTVVAGREWGATPEVMEVLPGRAGSWEDVLHRAVDGDRLFLFEGVATDPRWLEWRGHRAIGVVYSPRFERYGNYVPSVLSRRYDAFLYIDQTRVLRPLPVEPVAEGEVPETYPTGV